MPGGPQPIEHTTRLQTAQDIADKFMGHYVDQILALGIYGSLARDLDGPYSDIEMQCILKGDGIEESFEWSAGAWKAEVDVYSREVMLQLAAQVDEEWPFTHGCYVYVKPLFDPDSFFPILRQAVLSHPKEVFSQTIQSVIVGDVYEIIGKIRNAEYSNHTTYLPHYADKMAIFCACLIGLDQQHLYTSFTNLFEESLQFPDRPAGYDPLIQMVMSGELSDPKKIIQAINTLWNGLEEWAAARCLVIEHRLEDLLKVKKVNTP